jgi:23S rRNA pseudouridine1911/1915/1917 synthase
VPTDQLPLNVLYEDNHLLALIKPALLPTMGVAEGKPSLLSQARDYIRRKYAKPGRVYLGIVSRLDAPVSGIVLIARTSKAAARLCAQFRRHAVEKTYWAAVAHRVRPTTGELVDFICRDERHRRMRIALPNAVGALEARLSYRTLEGGPGRTVLEVMPETGRKHQIRLQLASFGHPILGDRKYGSRQVFPLGIALHCRRLVFQHPVRRQPIQLTAPLPRAWRSHGCRPR